MKINLLFQIKFKKNTRNRVTLMRYNALFFHNENGPIRIESKKKTYKGTSYCNCANLVAFLRSAASVMDI